MEFKQNHFYKLVKKIKEENFLSDGNNSIIYYGEYIYSSNNWNYYQMGRTFFVGHIYQAVNYFTIYDDSGVMQALNEDERACFEEVEIGLNESSKTFINHHTSLKEITFIFRFFGEAVSLTLFINNKYHVCVQTMGDIKDINEMIYNTYKEARKTYAAELLKTNFIKYKFPNHLKHERI